MPKPRIDKMSCRMLCTTHIHINGRPIRFFDFVYKRFFVFWINKSQVVPTRTSPLWHGVCFSQRLTATFWAFYIHPFVYCSQRRLASSGRCVIFYVWKFDWQILFRHRQNSACFAMDNWNRLAPVSLTGKHPVTELVLCNHFSTNKLSYVFSDRNSIASIELS